MLKNLTCICSPVKNGSNVLKSHHWRKKLVTFINLVNVKLTKGVTHQRWFCGSLLQDDIYKIDLWLQLLNETSLVFNETKNFIIVNVYDFKHCFGDSVWFKLKLTESCEVTLVTQQHWFLHYLLCLSYIFLDVLTWTFDLMLVNCSGATAKWKT